MGIGAQPRSLKVVVIIPNIGFITLLLLNCWQLISLALVQEEN